MRLEHHGQNATLFSHSAPRVQAAGAVWWAHGSVGGPPAHVHVLARTVFRGICARAGNPSKTETPPGEAGNGGGGGTRRQLPSGATKAGSTSPGSIRQEPQLTADALRVSDSRNWGGAARNHSCAFQTRVWPTPLGEDLP